jgi:AraC-like DNA-binding protein
MTRTREEKVSARSAWALHASAGRIGMVLDIADWFPGLDPHDLDGFVPLQQQVRFVRHVFDQGRETIGLELGAGMPFDGLGFWGFLLRSSPAFGDMLGRAERYIRIVNKYPEFFLETRGGYVAQVCAHPDPSPFGSRDQVVQCFLSHWLAWGRQLTGQEIAPVRATFVWTGPRDAAPFAAFYRCPLQFGADEDALHFDRATLRIPFPDSSRQLSQDFENHAAAMIRQMTWGDAFLPRVCAAIEDSLANGFGKEADVAERLAMTTRTLHRKLKSQNTSYRKLRDDVLVRKAKHLLAQDSISIAEVSFLLGYSEVSTFYRAFRRWTGSVPRLWREQNMQR